MTVLGTKVVFSNRKGNITKVVQGDLSFGYRARNSRGNSLGMYPTLKQAKRSLSTGRESKVPFSQNFRIMSAAAFRRFKG